MDSPPVALTKEELVANQAASRLQCRLALEAALEARFPRIIWKKPIFNGAPLDMYVMHQVVLRYGGYRRVDTANLWEKVAESMGFVAPATPPTSSGKNIMSSVKYQLREKAFRYLAWIENDAPPERVFGLQAASRAAPLPLDPKHPAVLAVAGLAGGNMDDALCPYLTDTDNMPWEGIQSKFAEVPQNSSEPVADDGTDSAAKRRRVDEGTPDVPPTAQPTGAKPSRLPPYARVLPAQVGWESDADRLYRIHDNIGQMAGAVAAHMNPYAISDDEESAFPCYSTAAHAATGYSELSRREVVRTTTQVYVIPPRAQECREILMGYDDLRYEGDSDTNVQDLANSIVYTAVGTYPKLPPVPRAAYHMASLLTALNISEAMEMTPELKKKLSRADPLTTRLAEGLTEQEPWIGTTMHRTLFYLELRNHILLKWVHSQNPQNPRNQQHTHPRNMSVGDAVSNFGIRANPPTHAAWSEAAEFSGSGSTYATIYGATGTDDRAQALASRLPLPLTLKEVLEGIPERFHEPLAVIFDHLEARGKINIGAIRLEQRHDPATGSFLPTAGRIEEPTTPSFKRKRIVIVGAGISGLAAARQLMQFGHDVVILEGRNRPGGRICTNRQKFGIAIDEGAMISTGDEPNPCSLLVRQLDLRQHVIQNMQTPLLLPRKYFARVLEIARERVRFTTAVDLWRKRFHDAMQKLVMLKHERADGEKKADGPLPAPAKEGRAAFGVVIPGELAHISNDAIKHALRIVSAHTTLVHAHIEFLKRLHKVLTAVVMAHLQCSDGGSADSHPSYGIFTPDENMRLAKEIATQLDAVMDEMQAATAYLQRPANDRALQLLQLAQKIYLSNRKDEPTTTDAAPATASNSDESVESNGSSEVNTITQQAFASLVIDADDEKPAEPFVVSIPTIIDLVVEQEFNALMDSASALKAVVESAPPPEQISAAYALVRQRRSTTEGAFHVAPETVPPGFAIVGNELVRQTYIPGFLERPTMAGVGADAMSGETTTQLVPVDPSAFRFETLPDGSIRGIGQAAYATDILPRQRLGKYADPRRGDDDVDGVYDAGVAVGSTVPAPQVLSDKRKTPVAPATRTTKKSGGGQEAEGASSSKLQVVRAPYYGKHPLWDMSIAEAIDYSATEDDVNRSSANNPYDIAGVTAKSSGTVKKIYPGVPRPPAVIEYEVPSPPKDFIPQLADDAKDSDGVVSGERAAISTEDPAPETVTFASLKRALFRWHTANLEYGCAHPMDNVSLQQWDQDDVFNYHDRGQHYFVKDGYDTHIRGLLPDVPIVYGAQVKTITYAGVPDAAVQVSFEGVDGPQSVTADAVIVTCPVGVLQSNIINFVPPLPQWKQDAIWSIGSGLLNKVILRFPTAFWREPQSSTAAEPSKPMQVDEATVDLLAGFGWGATEPHDHKHGHSAARARASISKAGAAFPSVEIVPAVHTPDDTVAMPPWLAHLHETGYINAQVERYASIISAARQAESKAETADSHTSIPLGHAMGREPERISSFVPFQDQLAAFHLQPAQLTDAQLASACSLALAAATDKSLSSSPYFRLQECVFQAVHAILEAKGDMHQAAALLRKWIESWGAVVESFKGQPDAALKARIAEWERKALIEETDPALAAIYTSSHEYASTVFPLPEVLPTAPVNPSPKASEEPAKPPPSTTNGRNPASVSEEQLAAIALVPTQLASSITPETMRFVSELMQPLAPPPPKVSFPTLSQTEDSFGRVVLGDSEASVNRRGEAYMFWCMDRYGLNATVYPSSQPSENTSDTSPVLIAMMAGRAAEWVETASDSEVLDRVCGALKSLFGDSIPAPAAHHITRWRSETFSRGTYSFLKPGSHGIHYDLMALPVNDVVCFAGEATNRHHPTTAAGAFDSGIREAVRLAEMFGRTRDRDVVRLLQKRAARLGVPLPPSLL